MITIFLFSRRFVGVLDSQRVIGGNKRNSEKVHV